MNKNTPEELQTRLNELAGCMGETLWCIQGLEVMLAKYYVVACKLSGTEPAEDIEENFEEHFRHTLGRMVGILKKDSPPDVELSQRLDEFTTERNWLVHRLRRQEYGALVDPSDFPVLAKRVKGLGDEAQALIELFNEMMIDHFVSLGCDRSFILETMEQEYKRIMNT